MSSTVPRRHHPSRDAPRRRPDLLVRAAIIAAALAVVALLQAILFLDY